MVFVLTFDEHGGFFDHVRPPRAGADDTDVDRHKTDVTRLGFRVPCIIGGPFGPARVDHGGPYEHCSILRMIEWRWGLRPMRARDRHTENLAHALDFSARRRPVALPDIRPGKPHECTPEQISKRITP
jgi:phospholipase C